MQENKSIRDPFIDVAKGLGIIAIVMGHASRDINLGNVVLKVAPFVYLYHLAIFAFCSGYLFNENVEDFWSYISKKLRSLYKPFMIYSVLYLLTRNVFINIGIIAGEKYTTSETVITFTNLLTFNSMGELVGAFWFVPMLFFAVCIYGFTWIWTKKIQNHFFRELLRLACWVFSGCIGIYAMENHLGLLCNIQVSYLMVPILALGNYFKRYSGKKILNLPGLLISFIILLSVIHSDIGLIELTGFRIINRWLFYPVTVCGVYFCLCMAHTCSRVKFLSDKLAVAGRYSFDIMALHFLAFKLVDYVACQVSGRQDILSAFPHSFTRLWPVYYVAGVLLPIVIQKSICRLKQGISSCSIVNAFLHN